MYAEICPDCGAYLDPGERCDCEDDAEPPPQDAFAPDRSIATNDTALTGRIARRLRLSDSGISIAN